MKPTESQFLTFQKIFDYFNRSLFNNELPSIILNFSRKLNTHGFFAPERWENGDKLTSHEISLNPQSLERPAIEVFATLVHEMVHLWQEELGDPPRRNYHNKEWASKMESVGLIPSDTAAEGGKKTGQGVSHYIEPNGRFESVFNNIDPKLKELPFKSYEGHGNEEKKKSKSKSKIKYTCPSCDLNAWGKEELDINCNNCNEQLIKEEK